MTTTNQGWRFQFEDGNVHTGHATDARGLRLRSECGYTHVKMGDAGWLQLSVAIRKLEHAERMSALVVVAAS